MKRYFIIIIIVFLLGLLGLQFLRQNEKEPTVEILEQIEDVSAENNQGGAQAPAVGLTGEHEPLSETEKLKATSTKTMWEEGNFPERLQVADLDMPLVFEGQVSNDLKQVILADINLVLGHVNGHEFYELPSKVTYKIPGQTEAHKANRGLIFNGLRVARPKEYRNNFGRVIEVGGLENVVVSAELISAYEKAWAARKDDPEKYESFESFINWFNTASVEDLRSNNPVWLYGYDGISDAYPEKAAELKASFLPKQARFGRPVVRHPSILEFTYLNEELLEKKGAAGKFPIGVTIADGKYIDEEGIPKGQALFLYDGKKWYIVIAPV